MSNQKPSREAILATLSQEQMRDRPPVSESVVKAALEQALVERDAAKGVPDQVDIAPTLRFL